MRASRHVIRSIVPATPLYAKAIEADAQETLTVIPLLWSGGADRALVETTEAVEDDYEGHELLWDIRTSLPIGADLEGTAHEGTSLAQIGLRTDGYGPACPLRSDPFAALPLPGVRGLLELHALNAWG